MLFARARENMHMDIRGLLEAKYPENIQTNIQSLRGVHQVYLVDSSLELSKWGVGTLKDTPPTASLQQVCVLYPPRGKNRSD